MKRAAFHPCHVHNWQKGDIKTSSLVPWSWEDIKLQNRLCCSCQWFVFLVLSAPHLPNQRSTKCTAYREPAGKELWPKWWTFCFNFNRFQYSFQQISIYFQSWFTFIFHVFPNRSRFLGWTHVCPARAVKSVAAGLSQLKRWRKKHQQRWDGLVFHKYLLTCYKW